VFDNCSFHGIQVDGTAYLNSTAKIVEDEVIETSSWWESGGRWTEFRNGMARPPLAMADGVLKKARDHFCFHITITDIFI